MMELTLSRTGIAAAMSMTALLIAAAAPAGAVEARTRHRLKGARAT